MTNADDRLLRWVRACSIVLVLLGTVIRFDGLDTKVFWHDETHTGCAIAGSRMRQILLDVFDGEVHTRDEVLVHQFPREGKTVVHTLRALAKDDPRQVPLYFVLAREWVMTLGSSTTVLRAFSAVLGILSLPLVFLLCRELFSRSLEAWIAVGLISVSPIHFSFAQEARQYILWVDLVILASWLLLVAMRRARAGDRAGGWFILYGFAIGLALFSHLLTVLVMAAHMGFVVVARRFRPAASVWMTLAAQLVVSAAFWPWARFILAEAKHRAWISWATTDVGLAAWLPRAAGTYVKTFFDTGEGGLHTISQVPAVLALLATVGCVVLLVRFAPPRSRLFILFLGLVCSLPMITVDLWSGGVRTLVSRYQFPVLLALELSVAFGIAHLLTNPARGKRWAGAGLAALIVGCGSYSAVIHRSAEAGWTKFLGRETLDAVRHVEQHPVPLVVSSKSNRRSLGMALSFAHTSSERTRLLLVVEPEMPPIPAAFEDVFLWNVSRKMRGRLMDAGWHLEETGVAELFRLSRSEGGAPDSD